MLQQIIAIALGIASAMHHLHERSITHGDLYAHNILIDPQATPLLSDFGAACLYEKGMSHAAALERLEVRAFGCLLEDMILRVDPQEKQSLVLNALHELQHDCMQETVMLRPDFTTIRQRIKNTAAISVTL